MSIDSHLPTRSDFLDLFKEAFYAAKPVQELVDAARRGVPVTEFVRASGSLPALVAAALAEELKRPLLYVAPDIRVAERVRDDLRSLLGHDNALLLPPKFAIPYDPLHQNQRFDERAAVFERLLSKSFDALIVVPPALSERYETLESHSKRMIRFSLGDEIDREALALICSEAGMTREVRAEEPGQFAMRGSVIDVYPASNELPIRLELWGDEIAEMRRFDPQSQRSEEALEEILFFAGERGETKGQAGLWEILPRNTTIFIDDKDALEHGLERHWEEIEYQYEKRRDLEKDRLTEKPDELFHRADAVLAGLMKRTTVIHRGAAAPTEGALNFNTRNQDSFLGDLTSLASQLKANRDGNVANFLFCDRSSQVDRMGDLLEEHGGAEDAVRIGVAPLHGGFNWTQANLSVYTDHEIFGRHKRTSPFRRRRKAADSRAFDELKRGDFVVHADFGVGRYLGPKTIKVGGMDRECLQVEFREGVKVYVRLEQFAKLQKFQGTEGGEPKLSKIGGSDWDRARRKTKEGVERLAKEILEIYARRKMSGGFAFRDDTPWQREMEAAFEFEDTPDQATAAEEVKRDMEQQLAMDRLLVGDVGFGKTEVAVRGAFKALQDSKQVAVLVPTTILAQQHYQTFVERLRRYPIKIAVLSRFRSRREQLQTVSDLADGKIDLVIGTHRLLSKDVHFKDLGLLIVDEEHRFGVKHKEALKRFRASVDVLSMSATPIPRTLHMALSGARDMSMISTPPHDRLPIETEIVPFDDRVIREAILREIARGGQAYFVHNRVQTIHATAKMIEKLLPDIKVGVAHGQMREGELETVMDEFLKEKYQVLVCTMIIESGLDLPNVNTLIVNRADRFGLAQLYQLRGRIGRSHRQAYAYLMTPPRMLLQTDAKRRLETIAENTRLGSGFQIAMRDLEIRGAGNLLGPEQSGYINSVGFELYTEMLSEAVAKLSEEETVDLPETPVIRRDSRDVKIDAPVDAVLPTEYIPDAPERVDVYRRLSRAQKPDEVNNLRKEMLDRFGTLPTPAEALLQIIEAQARAARAGVAKIDLHEDVAFLTFDEEWGGEAFDIKIAEVVAGLHELPYELRGTGPLGLRLDLEDCPGWTERWQRLQTMLAALPEDV